MAAEHDSQATAWDAEPQRGSVGGPADDASSAGSSRLAHALARLERAEALVEHAPDAIVILDVDRRRFVSVNAAAEELFGMPRASLLQVGPVEVSPAVQPDGRPSAGAAGEYVEQALAGGRPRFEWTHRRADGRDVPCEITLLRLPAADQRLVRGSVLDITERQEAERARRDAETAQAARRAAEAAAARLQAMVAGLNAIVWERDPQTLQVRFINARAAELLGYPTEQWLDDDGLALRILHPDDREAALAESRRAVAEEQNYSMSYRVRAADGRWLWLQHHGHVVRDEAGAPTALHAVLIDITGSHRREEAAALLAAAGRVLAEPGPVTDRLAEAAGLAVPVLGERATVWLRGDDGRYRPVAAAPAGSAPQVLALPPVAAPQELELAYRAGRPFVVPHVTDELLWVTASGNDTHFERLAELGEHAVLVVPLLAAGQVVGLLTLDAVDAARWADDLLVLAGDLGQRMAAMLAAERVATRQRYLHEVTVALSAAGTVAEAGEVLAQGLQRVLGASVVGVCRLEPDGLLHFVHDLGYPPGRREQFRAVRPSAGFPFADAARTGRPVWLTDRQAWHERYPEAVPHLLERTQGAFALPLAVGGRVLGTVAATFGEPRLFEADERAFLLALTDQAAAAFERAALADARRTMAETLQRSLLPGALPDVDSLAVTARYLPAVEGTQAGGDWFDVLALPGNRVAVAVGDVVGDGAAAAAVMGQLRSSLATLLLAGFSPARALELLDRFADHVVGARVSTAACLQLDPRSGHVVYSSAGHPSPLLFTEADSRYLDDGHSAALGLSGAGPRAEAHAVVPVGGALLLYTDGLIERHGATLDEGLSRLAGSVTGHRAEPLETLVDGVLTELVAEGAGDDIALVALRRLPARLRLELPADPVQLRRVRRAVARWAEAIDLDPDTTEDLQLAVGEAAANAVEHAYRDAAAPGRVVVEVASADDGSLTAGVTDTGAWRPVPADPGFRGRGLQMISTLAGDVDLRAGSTGTLLTFRLTPRARAAAPRTVPRPRAGGARPAAAERPATLTASDANGRRCLELAGDLDLAGVAAVRDPLLAELARSSDVTLDLTHLGYVASVGAGLLAEAVSHTPAAGLDVLLPRSGPARRLLDLTGLTALLRPTTGARPL